MDLEILKIASNTDNHKVLNNHTHYSKLKNSICGDEIQISLKVKEEKIIDIGYQCKACIYCQASASLLSINSKNKKISSIKNLLKFVETFYENKNFTFSKEWSVFNKILNKKNISRKECLMLPFKTLIKALNS